jgi:hypothetical protein
LFVERILTPLAQLGHEDVELQARAAYALAMHATDDPVRLKVQQVRTRVQLKFIVARAADSCNAFAAVHAQPVSHSSAAWGRAGSRQAPRLRRPRGVAQLVSRPHLLRQAPRSAAADVRLNPLRLSSLTLVRYTLKSMKLLIELLSNGNDDVQEQASCATCPSRCEIT